MQIENGIPFFVASGVYEIRCATTGGSYIGFSNSIWKRWQGHVAMLRRGVHYCIPMQQDWNAHGKDTFEFTILEKMDGDAYRMRLKEVRFMRERKPTYNGSNTQKYGFIQ